MTLEELQRLIAAGDQVELEVHGLDPMLYVIYRMEQRGPTALRDARGATLKYRSRYAAQCALADCGASRATFVHRSAYGEMVGLDTVGAATELREPLLLSRD